MGGENNVLLQMNSLTSILNNTKILILNLMCSTAVSKES